MTQITACLFAAAALTALAAFAPGCDWPYRNPIDPDNCSPRCPAGVTCYKGSCVFPDAGVDAAVTCPTGRMGELCKHCEVGYTGKVCDTCSREYARPDAGVGCEYAPPSSCKARRTWLIANDLPPEACDAAGRFSITESVSGQPTVQDTKTGRQWRRCAVGQSWDGKACSGTATSFEITDKKRIPTGTCGDSYAGKGDWRVPELDELETLICYDRSNPAFDLQTFPGLAADWYWSATLRIKGEWYGTQVTKVDLRTGQSWYFHSAYNPELGHVICVRDALPPLSRRFFAQASDGSTIRDAWTGLTWQRCSHGQSWDGSTCKPDEPKVVNWTAAPGACKSPWRLPSVVELSHLRKLCPEAPSIDAAAFPNTKATYYWSASKDAGNANQAWAVSFYDSEIKAAKLSEVYPLRCVK